MSNDKNKQLEKCVWGKIYQKIVESVEFKMREWHTLLQNSPIGAEKIQEMQAKIAAYVIAEFPELELRKWTNCRHNQVVNVLHFKIYSEWKFEVGGTLNGHRVESTLESEKGKNLCDFPIQKDTKQESKKPYITMTGKQKRSSLLN